MRNLTLFPTTESKGLPGDAPLSQIQAFHKKVEQSKVPKVTLRMEKGHDIEAACGQLRLQESPVLKTAMTPSVQASRQSTKVTCSF